MPYHLPLFPGLFPQVLPLVLRRSSAGPVLGPPPPRLEVPIRVQEVRASGSSPSLSVAPEERSARGPFFFPSSPSGSGSRDHVGTRPAPPKACLEVPVRTHKPLDHVPVIRSAPHPPGSGGRSHGICRALVRYWDHGRPVSGSADDPPRGPDQGPQTIERLRDHRPNLGRPGQWPRWRTCVARLHHGDLPAEPSRRNLTHRRSGRRRTCEHGVARHHRTHRAAEAWLSSSPMAGPEDAEDAGPRRSPFRSPRSGPARGSRWAARLARSRRRRPHVGSPRHRKPVVAVVTPMRSTARASVRSPPHRGSRAHRRP